MMNAKARKRKRQRDRTPEGDNNGSSPTTTTTTVKKSKTGHQPILPSQLQQQQHQSNIYGKSFLTENDGEAFHNLLRREYPGFCHLPAAHLPQSFHEQSKRALEKLRDAGYYQYDMVLAGGSILSRTFVQRTLVGDPGITYKYLGLRLFAHSWSGPHTPPQFRSIYHLNQSMIQMTEQQLRLAQKQNKTIGTVGSCHYNVTLINYMEPSSETLLKEEEVYHMGKASVSWHADSSLQDYSAIGVYHTRPAQKPATWDWKIALRRNPEEDHPPPTTTTSSETSSSSSSNTTTPPPAVVVHTQPGDAYVLLGEFNHTHQHMVLAGSSASRISSTHRVAVVEHDTYEYIRQRCSWALTRLRAELQKQPEHWNTRTILEAQAVLTEVEFEWIAQYWVQGAQHDVQHVWWQAPIRTLEEAWSALEKLTYKVVHGILKQKTPPPPQQTTVDRELLRGLIACLTTRRDLRTKWDERRSNKIYKRRITRPYQPMERPVFDVGPKKKRLPKDLTDTLQLLSQRLAELEHNPNPQEMARRSTSSTSSRSSNRAPGAGNGKQKIKHFKHHKSNNGVVWKPKK